MRDCGEYQAWISAQLDGELGEAERRELRAHLGGCADCAALYEAFSRVSGAMEPEELPEGLHERIMAPVYASIPKKKAPWLLPTLSAAACFAAIAAAVLIIRPAFRMGGSASTSASAPAMYSMAKENGSEVETAQTTAGAAGGDRGAGGAEAPAAAPEPVPAPAENSLFRYADAAAEDAVEAAEPEEGEDWRETALLLRAGEAGSGGVAAEVIEDPTGLFAPGAALLLALPEGAAPPEPGTALRVDFSRWDSDGDVSVVYVERMEAAG